MLPIFLKLMLGHALADFGFQSDWVAVNKNRHLNKTPVNWQYVMLAHAMIHGTMVYAVTSNLTLAYAEVVCHFLIDCGKCESWYGIHEDQIAHTICKLVWAVLA